MEKDTLINEGKELKNRINDMNKMEKELDTQMLEEGLKIPNLIHPEIPLGPEQNAKVLRIVAIERV